MDNTYHKMNLDIDLLEKTIEMINEEGIEAFSLRALARKCNVSHNAVYRHYASKEELLSECRNYVTESFTKTLEASIEGMSLDDLEVASKIGYAYIAYFQANPTHYGFIYNEDSKLNLTLSLDYIEGNYGPFEVFRKACEALTIKYKLPREIGLKKLVKCFSIVQGITSFIINQNIKLDGTWDEVLKGMFEA